MKIPVITRVWAKLLQLCGLVLLLFVANNSYASLFGEVKHPIPANQAFEVSFEQNNEHIDLVWKIAPGYYLYQDKLSFTRSSAQPLTIDQLPPAKLKEDPTFGTTKVYYNQLHVSGLHSTSSNGAESVPSNDKLIVTYQGCWEGGVCYPPQTTSLNLSEVLVESNSGGSSDWDNTTGTNAGWFTKQLQASSSLSLLLIFFVAGLALAFTPCVLPMVPILSSIIVGLSPKPGPKKSLALSATYVVAMAATYSMAGVAAGLSGANIQIALQHPIVIAVIATLFLIFAGAMFGWFSVEMPRAIQQKLNTLSQHQKGGQYAGVAVMGALSALIVGPCVAAPLAGALIFIAQSGDPILGGIALFSMGIGMGLPLLLVGTSAARWIPSAGPWMKRIKVSFGFLMIAMALWMTDRIWPEYTFGLISLLALAMALVLALNHLWQPPIKSFNGRIVCLTLAMLLGGYGVMGLVGQVTGEGIKGSEEQSSSVQGTQQAIVTKALAAAVPELLSQAKTAQEPVMLDFYADWCISCKELDAFVFTHPEVQSALSGYRFIKVDVTANEAAAKELMASLQLVGPPALVFYNAKGQLLLNETIVGVPKVENLVSLLNRVAKQ